MGSRHAGIIPAITRAFDGAAMKVNIQIARILPTKIYFRTNYFLFKPQIRVTAQ
jgi:hypothetical protein